MGTRYDPKGIVIKLLSECLDTHKQRESQYDTRDNVFKMTATIANTALDTRLDAEDIAFIFVAMKLARYGNIRNEIIYLLNQINDKDSLGYGSTKARDLEQLTNLTNVMWDTIKDAMVYLGLTERERQNKLKNIGKDEDTV